MTGREVRARVREVLAEYCDLSADPTSPLNLDSLTVVELVERLEQVFAVRLRATDVVPENFACEDALVGLVTAKIRGRMS